MSRNLHPDKRPFRAIKTWTADVDNKPTRHVEYEADFWHGGCEADDVQGYYTVRSTINARHWRNKVSPSVSYWPELAKALGV